ncbi:sialic acid-specific 9-O-acetylesterase [Lentisphaera araneosa HTCC2155]|uniref:Sialic acid-specific 9-O-acetylesterase n=1 Tax=Lentisphaera araneosa HTCC2155 TaxID=313628 RepID=A6DH60_9BACT|nr:sialate O-acetylesterase [Lentisphaera araneosa]EDM28943.1 sialic acid-specific 9-O-acetylesterase [Lentisphaera araneosa HTCC2155]
MNKLLLAMLAFFCSLQLSAEIKLHQLFSDGAVFQRGQTVPVWGWADAGTTVEVSFAGQTKSVKADQSGKWMIKLDSLKASEESRKLTVKSGAETLTVNDILVGEVWICSGQSNMDWRLTQLTKPARDPFYNPISEYVKKEIETANDPLLRQIEVKKEVSPDAELKNINGNWVPVAPANSINFTATGYFFARELRKTLNVPVGLIKCAWGGTLVEPWVPMPKYQTNDELKAFYAEEKVAKLEKASKWWTPEKAKAMHQEKLAEWETQKAQAKEKGKKFNKRKPRMIQDPAKSNRIPSTLYNGMIAPLVPYAVKGAIWYQGESNAGYQNDKYQKHFSALIEGWRTAWDQDRLDFYFCQLAQFRDPVTKPIDNDGWVNVIYQQFLTALAVPNTGVAVLNDIGEANDIHPHNKVDAGKRLSLWALAKTYGKDLAAHSGPLYKSSKIEGSKVIIDFDSVGAGLMTGKKILLDPVVEVQEELKHFQIKGADNVWKWANAKIISKNQVEVSHPEVSTPVEVRYAWAANAKGANLYNKEGIPASVFKTK